MQRHPLDIGCHVTEVGPTSDARWPCTSERSGPTALAQTLTFVLTLGTACRAIGQDSKQARRANSAACLVARRKWNVRLRVGSPPILAREVLQHRDLSLGILPASEHLCCHDPSAITSRVKPKPGCQRVQATADAASDPRSCSHAVQPNIQETDSGERTRILSVLCQPRDGLAVVVLGCPHRLQL